MRKISAREFARRLREATTQQDKRFAFFLGAGCSTSSGIPAAGQLVKDHWLPRLKRLRDPDHPNLDTWAKEQFPDYDPENPAQLYGAVIDALFLQPEDRQREIERLCENKVPGFGYAALASLIAKHGDTCNVVLTTNFDDMVSDALYLYTETRPLVIQHEALAGFIRATRTRPLVVKVHGDHRLSPYNTQEEIADVKEQMEQPIRSLLHDRGLIFMGYGGNDEGIRKMLERLPEEALPVGIYWVSRSEPTGSMKEWLKKRRAVWVESANFDEMFLLMRDELNLPHPSPKRFDKVFKDYQETYKKLADAIMQKPAGQESDALKKAVQRTDKSFPDFWAVIAEADRVEKSNPDQADSLYRSGIEQFPTAAPLLGNYSIFLKNIRQDFDRAEEMYQRALQADPTHAILLGNYALFLENVRKDFDRAEELYQRALQADPNHVSYLGNYALFLENVRKDFDRAEELYQRALQADPTHANNLGNYALFLETVRKDFDRAEELYQRALQADPDDADYLGNYAIFLQNVRQDFDQARDLYQRALQADPTHANNLGNYAIFLQNVRQDFDQARDLYQQAIAADPGDRDNLINCTGFLLANRKLVEGLKLADQIIAKHELPYEMGYTVEFWFYALVHWPANKQPWAIKQLKTALLAGTRSPGWDLIPHVDIAQQDHHPDAAWIDILASVIAEGTSLDALAGWEKWQAADQEPGAEGEASTAS